MGVLAAAMRDYDMVKDISDDDLIQFSRFLVQRIGLEFNERRLPELRRGIKRAAIDFGLEDIHSCVNWLVSAPLTRDRIETLASYLTIGETYFFRDDKIFKVLEEHILPDLIRTARSGHRILRIWSAGCSTGEEPYSLSILLSRIIPDFHDWNITILATDINAAFLKKASEGIYTEWSFRGSPQWLTEQYFSKTKKGQYRLISEIRHSVRFAYHNLAEDPYPSLLNNTNAMNIIFCRNVLMYFGSEFRKKVIEKFSSCLVEGGWLLVSPAETPLVEHHCLQTVSAFETIIHRKTGFSAGLTPLPENLVTYLSTPLSNPELPLDISDQPVVQLEDHSDEHAVESFETPPAYSERLFTYEEALELYNQGRYADVTAKVPATISGLSSGNRDVAGFAALLARAYANQGFLSEAQLWCSKATMGDKLNPRHHYLFATILQERGENEEAMKSLQRAIYLDQDFVIAHFALANLARSLNRSEKSRKHFQNVLRLLEQYQDEQVLPEAEGMTAGRLKEIVRSMADEV